MEIGRNYDTALGIVADTKLALQALAAGWREASCQPASSRTAEIQGLLRNLTVDTEGLGSLISAGYEKGAANRIGGLAVDRAAYGKWLKEADELNRTIAKDLGLLKR